MKTIIPVFAMALAVLGAFAFTTHSNTEEVATIGVYDSNFDGICDTQYDCGPVGDLCFEIESGQFLPVYKNTDCTVQLRMP